MVTSKKALCALALLAALAPLSLAADTPHYGAALPATCTPSIGAPYFFTFYLTTNNTPYHCSATNVWTPMGLPQSYGEMYFYTASAGAPTSLAIQITAQYHGVALTASGTTLSGWTYKAGVQGVISAVADNSGTAPGTILVTTSAPHNLAVGDYVCQVGFTTRTTYQGKYKVLTTPLTTTYTVARAFQTSTDTGWFQRSWSLRANTGSAGLYRISFTMSAQSANNTTDFRFELNRNATDLDNIAGQTLFSNANRAQGFTGIGLLTIADDDVIYMSVKNITDAADFSVWLSNLSLNRL